MLRLAKFVKTKRGRDALNLDGFIYHHATQNEDKHYWVCRDRYTLDCKGAATTKLENEIHMEVRVIYNF